jgi:putative glutamine amidotransferase
MTAEPPRIAIPEPTSTDASYNRRALPQYVRAVEGAGGIAVPVPLLQDAAVLQELVASCSAILLPGSPADVDPDRYGHPKAKETAKKDAAREEADKLLLGDAFAQGKPILGICYGLQSLNVWKRGSLVQHLPLPGRGGGLVNHRPGREVLNAHAVVVTQGTRLAQLAQEEELSVNSSHHQAIGQPGDSLRVAAVSAVDGVIEALEGVEPTQFVVGVQWHPERTIEHSAASRALFAIFVEAARSWGSR